MSTKAETLAAEAHETFLQARERTIARKTALWPGNGQGDTFDDITDRPKVNEQLIFTGSDLNREVVAAIRHEVESLYGPVVLTAPDRASEFVLDTLGDIFLDGLLLGLEYERVRRERGLSR